MKKHEERIVVDSEEDLPDDDFKSVIHQLVTEGPPPAVKIRTVLLRRQTEEWGSLRRAS